MDRLTETSPNNRIDLPLLEPIEEKVSADGTARKLLFRLEDGNTIESALMSSLDLRFGRERHTVCVSSQVGCAIGCPFCATGRQGFVRNLSGGEIFEQVMYFVRRFDTSDRPNQGITKNWLTNVVLMGMGEPLANYGNTCRAISTMNSQKKGLGLGVHQVTLSTCGLAPQIQKLCREGLQYQLAVSLHAANDQLRDYLVPVNKKYPLEALMAACREHGRQTRKNTFIEYALFDGLNDSVDDAEQLLKLLDGLQCSINLIAGNPTGSGFKASSPDAAAAFQKRMMAGGIRTMLRIPRGTDIEAGCGQLRSRQNTP